jgi:hypothetical protein
LRLYRGSPFSCRDLPNTNGVTRNRSGADRDQCKRTGSGDTDSGACASGLDVNSIARRSTDADGAVDLGRFSTRDGDTFE